MQYFIDYQSPNYDELYKLGPILDYLNKNILSIPMCEWLTTDENFYATNASIHVYKKYKSHIFGYELLELCVDIGFACKTEIYCRQMNKHKFWKIVEPYRGASGSIVIWLYRDIARPENKILCSDRHHTPLLLAVYLFKQAIHCIGTAQWNTISNWRSPNGQHVKKAVTWFFTKTCHKRSFCECFCCYI